LKELGQLFITGISGLSLTPEEAEFIQEENIGGVIIFAHNYQDPAQLAELINEIQKLRDEYPLFICIDHEGGRVHRLKDEGFTHFPSMAELVKLGSPKIVFEVFAVMATELSAVGINLSFGPVCDILTNSNNKVIGDRSFGEDPLQVEKYVSAAIRGSQTNNMLACAKHFPGHGGTTKDSHFDLPLVKTDLETLKNRELIPFVKASKSRVEFVMMAHLMVDALNDELPTTLSKQACDFLRSELKFKKIIISDDMDMKAISDRFSYGEAAVMAFEAGLDILEYRSFDSMKTAYLAVKASLEDGKLDRKQMELKEKRVLTCKKAFLSEYKPKYIPNISKAMKQVENQKFLKEIHKKLD
jgi:beta-N-acetylhexosaminidase